MELSIYDGELKVRFGNAGEDVEIIFLERYMALVVALRASNRLEVEWFPFV